MRLLGATTKRAYKDAFQIWTWLHLLLAADFDPREAIMLDCDWQEWIEFLHETGVPLFPWEFSADNNMWYIWVVLRLEVRWNS